VIVIMSGKSYMLPEIEGGEEREKLRCERVSVIINVYIKVQHNSRVQCIDDHNIKSSVNNS